MQNSKLSLKGKMDRSFLIQRLEKPSGPPNPFTFGGGLKNGGLSNQAASLLSTLFSFDYMGAAEFEWGAVPAAIDFIGKQAAGGHLVSGIHEGVYYICPRAYEAGVKELITKLLDDESALNLKEGCGLKYAMSPYRDQKYPGHAGWLELDNGFFFFSDQEVFENTKRFFGVK